MLSREDIVEPSVGQLTVYLAKSEELPQWYWYAYCTSLYMSYYCHSVLVYGTEKIRSALT